MATTLVFPNTESLSLPVHAGTASGDPVMAGTQAIITTEGIPGVALTAISLGVPPNPTGFATVATRGAFDVLVDTNTGIALDIGSPVFWNIAGNVLSSLNTDELWGVALEALINNSSGVITVAIQPRV